MAIQNKYRMLVWVIVILIATNLSMGFSFLYHKQQDRKLLAEEKTETFDLPAQQRTRYFREQLNLKPYQVEIFRELNRGFNRTAWQINHRLEALRIQMVKELGKPDPDAQKLEKVSHEIGELHTKLKNETIEYYLAMKEVCTDEQKEKLNRLFMSVLQDSEDVRLPQHGRRFRNNQ
jgi:Spy/CpxP family protein refolding chaperone